MSRFRHGDRFVNGPSGGAPDMLEGPRLYAA